MDEGETSIKDVGSHRQIEAAAILQQMQFSNQQNKTLDILIHSLKVGVIEILGKLHKEVLRMANSPLMYSIAREGHGTWNILTRSVANECATLSASPKSLHTLWLEYQQEISGRKPAKLFTPGERGRVKHKYCMRKSFCELIIEMVQHGFTSQVAIDKVYKV